MTPSQKSSEMSLERLWRRAMYGALIARWRARTQILGLWKSVIRHSAILRQSFIVLLGFGLGAVVSLLTIGVVTRDLLGNYLVATAAMTGGTTAIVFSVTIFLLQSTQDLYSFRSLDEYVNSGLRVIYVTIIAITLAFLGGALYLYSVPSISSTIGSAFVIASLGLVALVFALLDAQYGLIRKKINPYEMVAFIGRKARHFLSQVERNAKSLAKSITPTQAGSINESALALIYRAWLQRGMGVFDSDIGLLLDMVLRLAQKNEMDAAKAAIAKVADVISAYIAARKTSSVALASSEAFLVVESDSQHFLATHYERLNRVGWELVDKGQDDLATQVVYAYETIANASKDVKYIGLTHDNPILEQAMWSLNAYMTQAESPNREVLFQGAHVLGEIGVMAARAHLNVVVLAVQENLEKAAMFGMGIQTTIVANNSVAGLLNIILAAFERDGSDRDIAIETSLSKIADILISAELAARNSIVPESDLSFLYERVFATGLPLLLNALVERYERIPETTKARQRMRLTAFFENMRHFFRRLAQGTNAGSMLAGASCRLISSIDEMILAMIGREDFADVRHDLRQRLKNLIHSPYWFVAEGGDFEAGDYTASSLGEVPAQTGIIAWRALNDEQIVLECITAIDAIATKMLERTPKGPGYSESRAFENALYLGVLASKSEWMNIWMDLQVKIIQFEGAYWSKYGRSCPLRKEFEAWEERFESEQLNRTPGVLDDPQSMMYALVNEEDVATFISRMWVRLNT